MMNRVLKYSVDHPVSVLMAFSLTVIVGVFSVFMLNVNFLPQISDRAILVACQYPGEGADDIENLVTKPLEDALYSLKGIKSIESVSREGLSLVMAQMHWGVNMATALTEAKSIVDTNMEDLPHDILTPKVEVQNENDFGTIRLCVVPKKGTIQEATNFCKEQLKSRLLCIPEAGRVKILGGQKEEIKISVDAKKAARYSLTQESISDAIDGTNFDYPAGTVKKGQDEILIKSSGRFKNFFELLETPVKNSGSGIVRLKDIATVKKDKQKPKSFFMMNGSDCIQIEVSCKKTSSPLSLSKSVRAFVKNLKKEFYGQYDFIIQSDGSKEIFFSLLSLLASAIFGSALLFFILKKFFSSYKMALIVSSVVPLCILFCLCILFFLQRTINLVSLLGMSVSIGMIVDNSLVSIQSIIKEKNIVRGSQKVVLSNLASTLTTALVFLPIFFMDDIIKELFFDLALMIISGVLFSLAFSFTVLPSLLKLFFEKEIPTIKAYDFSRMEGRYKNLLTKTLSVKGFPAKVCICLALFSLPLLIFVKKEISSPGSQTDLYCKVEFQPGTSIHKIKEASSILTATLQKKCGPVSVFAFGGIEEDNWEELFSVQERKEKINFFIKTKNPEKTRKEFSAILNAFCPAEKFYFYSPEPALSKILKVSQRHIAPRKSDFSFSAECVFPSYKCPTENFVPDKGLLYKNKCTLLDFERTLKNALEGINLFPYYENGREIQMRLCLLEEEKDFSSFVDSIPIKAGPEPVYLKSLGTFKSSMEEGILYRYNKKAANVILFPKKGEIKSAKKILGKNLISPKNENTLSILKTGGSLLLVVAFLLYCLLGALSESFFAPLVFLSSVPQAFFGAVFLLFITGKSLDLNAIIALVLLFGTGVNNAIILYEAKKEEERSVIKNKDPLFVYTSKLSVIFITTLTSVSSLLPFCFSFGGKNPQSSMAVAVIGGLCFSSGLSLFTVPHILKKGEPQKNEILFTQKGRAFSLRRIVRRIPLLYKRRPHTKPSAQNE